MNDTQISFRQQQILEILRKSSSGLLRNELEVILVKKNLKPAKATLIRDLNELLGRKFIYIDGIGRSTKYISNIHPLLFYIDLEEYFSKETDSREIKKKFTFTIFEQLENLFTEAELEKLTELNLQYQKNTQLVSADIYKKELERFVIDLSWKSSKIEGNTYTLLETERLIRELKPATGHTPEEAQMILNHKRAFEVILKNQASFRKLTKQNIFDIHRALIDQLGVSFEIRKTGVGITGTKYLPLDNQWQIEEALEKMIKVIQKLKHPLEKALVAIAMLSYTQAFDDGNKRTARLVSNALLIAYNYTPLSYRNVDEIEYKKALLVFYEQNNLYHLKKIFIKQFEFSVANYFANFWK